MPSTRRTTLPPRSRSTRGAPRGAACRAFTLFELILVVLIIGIVGVIVIPAVVSASTSPGLRAAANMLAADIEYTQSTCINTPQSLHLVRFDLVNNRYWVAPASATTSPIAHPADGQPYLNDFATGRSRVLTGVSIISISPATPQLAFDAYGKPQNLSSNLVITLGAGNSTMALTIDATTGEITIN